MVITTIGTVLAASYLLWLLQRTTFSPPTPSCVPPATPQQRFGASPPTRRSQHDLDDEAEHDPTTTSTPSIRLPVFELSGLPSSLLISMVVVGISYPLLMFPVIEYRP